MPAPAAFSRRQFPGAAADTTITGAINSSDVSVALASASGWPTGAYTGGVLCELYSTTTGATAEKVWATDLTGTTLTIVRAADGTTAASHSAGTGIRPVAGAIDADEANKAVSETVGQVTTAGDLLVADGANSMTRLAKGADGEVLAMVAGSLDWTTVPAAAIAANTITNTMMADDSVDSAEIVDGAIDLVHMSANSVDSDQYVDGSIDRVHLSADIIDGTKLADDSVDSEHIVDGSIDTAHIADDQVTLAKLAASAKPRWAIPVTIGTLEGTESDTSISMVVPEACSVIGLSVAMTAARTAGSIAFEVTKNGSGVGLTATIDDDPTQYAYATQAETADTFAAGDRISVSASATAYSAGGGGAGAQVLLLMQAV